MDTMRCFEKSGKVERRFGVGSAYIVSSRCLNIKAILIYKVTQGFSLIINH
jgi:hypothetical protein